MVLAHVADTALIHNFAETSCIKAIQEPDTMCLPSCITQEQARWDMESLHCAAQDGDLETAQVLLARGADVNAKVCLDWTCQALFTSSPECDSTCAGLMRM